MPQSFLDRLLEPRPILCDGAMGTQLYAHGVSFERCFDELNLIDRNLVNQIHRDYIAAGAELIETNTFGANRFKLAAHGLENSAKLLSRAGAQIARDAREIAGIDCYVAGSIGPLGKPLAPMGTVSRQEAQDAFSQQAEGLLEGGVDLIFCETLSDLLEAEAAVEAIRRLSADIPIVCCITFDEEQRTLHGDLPANAAAFLSGLPVQAIGANCSVGPQPLLETMLQMQPETSLPLAVLPNAGLPQLRGQRIFYLASPEYFATRAKEFAALGCRLIGGCCGTTPEHIRKMAEALREDFGEKPTPRTATMELRERIRLEAPSIAAAPQENTFQDKLTAGRFVTSVELDPPRGINPQKLLDGARMLKERGADAVNVADSPMARVRMSALVISHLAQQEVGLPAILHFTCRDRNLMGLQSDLLGCSFLGIRNILCITGDPPRVGDYPAATAVYDVDSIGLVRICSTLNQGMDFAGNAIGSGTNFFIGCGVCPGADDLESELDRFRRKIDNGAQYAFTQPLYDIQTIKRFLDSLGACPIPILLGILPLHSTRHCEFLHNEVPGITIPASVRERMLRAGEDGGKVGVELAQQLLSDAKQLFQGVYLMPSFGRYDRVAQVLDAL